MNAYSEKEKTEIFDDICEKIINGKSLRSVLRELNPSIAPSTFFIWLREDISKSKQYEISTKERSELMFEEMFDIADDSVNDYIKKEVNGIEIEVLNTENIQRSRLRIDTRKWALSKMNPKKYGDKTDITTNGEKITNIPIIQWVGDDEDK
jgi:hypothetical protein